MDSIAANELLTMAKVMGAAGGGTAVLVWVITRPHVLETLRNFGDWVIKVRSQSADLAGVKARLQIESELQIAAARKELTGELKAEVKTLRTEVAALHMEVAKWMLAERGCRDEVHEMRNKMNTLVLQNQVMAEQNTHLAITGDRSAKLLDALEKHQPEWFGQERRNGERRTAARLEPDRRNPDEKK